MKLVGNYSADVTYSVGDVVLDSDKEVYILQNAAPAGSAPKDTLYWGRLNQPLDDVARMVMDGLDLAQGEVEKYFLNDQTLLLKTGEGETETTYAITVDDSGDTPELAVEEVTDGGEG